MKQKDWGAMTLQALSTAARPAQTLTLLSHGRRADQYDAEAMETSLAPTTPTFL